MTDRELIVDSFAGGGGASDGIRRALGRGPDRVINHDWQAIAMHRMNHPEAQHFTEDVRMLDPRRVTGGRPVGLMWLSPDCRHFSRAKGGKPVNRKIRGLASVATWWAREVAPRVIILENVPEFLTWGPLGPDNKPDPHRKGASFRRYVSRLRNLGYQVEYRELCAADYGAPTSRRRLFLVTRRDGEPVRWPTPTHPPDHWRAAAEVIDWSVPAPSIFERERPLVVNTEARIANGVRRFVLDDPDPFVIALPRRDHPDPRLVAAFVARHFTGVDGISLRQPIPTITARDHHALVTVSLGNAQERAESVRAFVIAYFGNERDGSSLRQPLRTVTSRDRFALVTVHGAITDIGHRMFVPRELYRAQGFGDAYEIEHGIDDAGNIVTFPKTAQVRMVGNSVPPPLAEAVVRAQFGLCDYETDLFTQAAA